MKKIFKSAVNVFKRKTNQSAAAAAAATAATAAAEEEDKKEDIDNEEFKDHNFRRENSADNNERKIWRVSVDDNFNQMPVKQMTFHMLCDAQEVDVDVAYNTMNKNLSIKVNKIQHDVQT